MDQKMGEGNSKKHGINKNYPKKKRNKTSSEFKVNNVVCPCGGGQSCLIERRIVGDWVHEDDIFKENGLPLRKTCFDIYSFEQESALASTMHGNINGTSRENKRTSQRISRMNSQYIVFDGGEHEQSSIFNRWEDDANSDRL